jgi:hypothetical protein
MSTPISDPKWKITNGSGQPTVGNHLDGYVIKKTAGHYELHGKLASVAATQLPVTFRNVTIDGQSWDITVNTLPSSTDAGSWTTPSAFAMKDDDTTPQSGEFTAQTDGGVVADEAVASAGHGKY